MAAATMTRAVLTPTLSNHGDGMAGLKLMRKGTKSCQECRRRKIKCKYPEEADGDSAASVGLVMSAGPATESRNICIECQSHDRQCGIQGVVASDPHQSCLASSLGAKAPNAKRPPARIYKRRRNSTDADEAVGQSSHPDEDQEHPRVKIQVNRIDSVVKRLARERESESSPGSRTAATQPFKSSYPRKGFVGTHKQNDGDSHHSGGFSHEATEEARTTTASVLAPDHDTHNASPLIAQLFNNEMLTQASPSPAVLAQKVQTLTFSNLNSNSESMSDVEKLRSTISPEPYLLNVLETSTTWWIAWRDQSFALHEVFFNPKTSSTLSDSAISVGTPESWPHQEIKPTSLHDFVLTKLSEDNAISVATALLCIAMSLQNLRPGIDDIDLNISATPADIAERILLAVDTVLLSPSSDPAYMRDPGLLLVYMMRAKMYAESNQLRKSWLSIRKAIEVARECGFTDPQPSSPDENDGFPDMTEAEITRLLHRQRWIGSILEMDRLMSMVLGFPHAQDDKFSDQLALAVLKGQAPTSLPGQGELPVDLKMRALRRVVAVIAGRVNDRNASSESDDAKLCTTMSIQSSLDEAAAAMPSEWWDINTHMQHSDPYVTYQHLMAQMWFWQVQSFLHLPYMMKPGVYAQDQYDEDGGALAFDPSVDPYLPNRIRCLQGCRGMLRVFSLLRSEPSLAVYICPCEDFQGIFNACILMVGLLTRFSYCPDMAAPSQATKDWLREDLDLIEEIKDILRYRAAQSTGTLSRQGLKVLEELSYFLDNNGSNAPRKHTVILPYFGAIHLEMKPGRYLRERTRQLGLDVPKAEAPPADSTLTMPADSAVDLGLLDPTQGLPVPETEEHTDPSPYWLLPEANLDWDQFLFGNELGQNWNFDAAEWPYQDDDFNPS